MKQFICDILSKMASGRYILTLACALVFGICAVKRILPVDSIVAIITMVFISYFQRQDRQKGEQK